MGELKLPFSSDNNIFRTRGGGRSTELQDPAACRTDFYLMYFSIQNYILYVSICEINKERTIFTRSFKWVYILWEKGRIPKFGQFKLLFYVLSRKFSLSPSMRGKDL